MARLDDSITINVTGASGLDQIFKKLSDKVQNTAVRKGVSSANKIFRDAGKRNAPIGPGRRLSRSVKSKVSTKFNVVTGTTGIKAGKDTKYNAWYANFVEYGTKQRVKIRAIYHPKQHPTWIRTDKTGKNAPRPISLGSFPPSRFMLKTYMRNKGGAIAAFQKTIKGVVLTTWNYEIQASFAGSKGR